MATGTEGSSSAEAASGEATQAAVTASSEATTATTTTTTGPSYKAVDPGYSMAPDDAEALEQLRGDKKTPSETSDDASDAEDSDVAGETEETQETAAGDEVSNEISDELLDRAVALGYDFEDIKDVTDVKKFEKEIVRAEKLRDRLASKKTGETQKPEKLTSEEDKEPDWKKMIEDGHDPEVIALQQRNWQRATAAEARVKQLEQVELARAAQAQADQFDDALNNLGEGYEAILGKGRIGELTKSSPEQAQNRVTVFKTMSALKAGYEAQGVPVPSQSELIEQAVQARFHKQVKANARESLKKDIRNAGSQALSRPRSGGNKQLTGPALAEQIEREFWKNHS